MEVFWGKEWCDQGVFLEYVLIWKQFRASVLPLPFHGTIVEMGRGAENEVLRA